jgi:hypothetical protein
MFQASGAVVIFWTGLIASYRTRSVMPPKRKRKAESVARSVESGATETAITSKTKRYSSAQFTVNVGGTMFITSKHTLVAASPFFAAMLSGQFMEGRDDEEEICVDRSPVAFPIILEFMRSSILFCDRENGRLLGPVLAEADFYGMDQLVYHVKLRCFLNLHPSVDRKDDPELLEKVNAEFPTVQDLICHEHFPSLYYQKHEAQKPNKIVSISPLPTDTYVEFTTYGDHKMRCRAIDMITFECGNVRKCQQGRANGSV